MEGGKLGLLSAPCIRCMFTLTSPSTPAKTQPTTRTTRTTQQPLAPTQISKQLAHLEKTEYIFRSIPTGRSRPVACSLSPFRALPTPLLSHLLDASPTCDASCVQHIIIIVNERICDGSFRPLYRCLCYWNRSIINSIGIVT